MSNKPRKPGNAAYQLETLERRILFSADLPFPFVELSSLNTSAHIGLISSTESAMSSSSSPTNSEQHGQSPVEIVIIDSAKPDYESIVADLEKRTNSHLQIYILDADRDGIEQISKILRQYENVGALHLISYGSGAQLNLGDATVDFTELLVRADEFAGWQDNFTAGADLLIYGCDLDSSELGCTFVSTLGNLTGTDVTESDDLSQNSKLSGEYERKSSTGQLETISASNLESQQPWQGVLADEVPVVTGISDVASESVTVETIALTAQEVQRELVFIDPGVDDYETLIQDIQTSTDTSRNIDVVVLDPTRDGVEQITETLKRYENLDAVHIVSHGDEGAAQLGDTWLSYETLSTYKNELASWSSALSENADLLFHGCDLAAGENGEALEGSIAKLTEADVAASSDLTGSAILGGDWSLESRTGNIETKIAFSDEAQQNWQGVLASFTVDTLLDTADADLSDGVAEDASGNTSIRAAIEQANALGGTNTISVGAGMYKLGNGELTISSDITITGAGVDQTFIDGDALSRVFHITSGTVTLSELTIQNGDGNGNSGGGVYVNGGTNVTLDHVVFYSNTEKDGAALFNELNGTLVVQSSTVDGNTATYKGGGIHNLGSLTLLDTTISNNSSTQLGGGVFEDGTFNSFTNVTISGNYSADDGGGIYTKGSAVSLQNVTLTENISVKNGGGIAQCDSPATLHNVVVAGNSGNNDPDQSGAFSSSGGNLIGDVGIATGFIDGVNGDQVGDNITPIDALLGALADNGGQSMTHALLVGSPAIDGGTSADAPATDQNGIARNDGSIDIGAFEFVPQVVPTDLQVITATDGSLSLNEDGGNDAYLIADNGAAIFGWSGRVYGRNALLSRDPAAIELFRPHQLCGSVAK